MPSTMSSTHTAGDIASQSLVESSSESSPPSPCVTLNEEAVTSRCQNETDFLSLSQALDKRLLQAPDEILSRLKIKPCHRLQMKTRQRLLYYLKTLVCDHQSSAKMLEI